MTNAGGSVKVAAVQAAADLLAGEVEPGRQLLDVAGHYGRTRGTPR